MPSPPDLPFISLEEKIGDPPLSWEHFKAPKLRWLRAGEFFIDEYLGSGLDGMVFKATFENLGVVALKIVSSNILLIGIISLILTCL